MKKIRITEGNIDIINEAIEAAEGRRVTARRIDARDVLDAAHKITQRLQLPKKYMHKMCYDVDVWAQRFPKKYKGIPESTHFVMQYSNGFWYLLHVSRERCGEKYAICTYLPVITADYMQRRTIENAVFMERYA